MQYEDTIGIRGVTVMQQTQLRPGSTVGCEGDVGIIVLKRPFAVEHAAGDRYPPLRERMIGLRGSGLLLLGILVAPLVMVGYVGLTVLLFLPLLGLRRMIGRRSMPAIVRWDGHPPRYAHVGNLRDAATGSA